MLHVLVPLAKGFEEIEAVTIIDVLRRADIQVTVAGIDTLMVEGSHGISIQADCLLSTVNPHIITAMVLPGGMPGTTHLEADDRIIDLAKQLHARTLVVGAICAAPRVLNRAGLLNGKTVTIHPAHRDHLTQSRVVDESAVVDGTIITGKAAGSAMEFSFKLVEILKGKEEVARLNQGIHYPLV